MSELVELAEGDALPEREKEITQLQMFRYSAITWNPHRIHYDRDHARNEGHPDVLIQAHLHGSLIQELLLDLAGTAGTLRELEWRNVGRATGESKLTIGGEITTVDEEAGTISTDVWTKTDGEICAQGSATLAIKD